jgi:hypothetical protein
MVNVVIGLRAFRRIAGGFCGKIFGLIFVVTRFFGSIRSSIENAGVIEERFVLAVPCLIDIGGGAIDSIVANELLDGIRG